MKTLNNYLPKKEPKSETVLVQGKIPKQLKDQAKEILKAKRLTWDDLIIAAAKQLIELK